MSLLLADGQLGIAAGSLVNLGVVEEVVSLTLFNTLAQDQTAVIQISRAGGTIRTIFQHVLKTKESAYIIGLPLGPSDTLYGYSTSVAAVDYLVMQSAGPFAIFARDAVGSPKASAALSVTLPANLDVNEGTVTMIGLLEDIRDVLLKIA